MGKEIGASRERRRFPRLRLARSRKPDRSKRPAARDGVPAAASASAMLWTQWLLLEIAGIDPPAIAMDSPSSHPADDRTSWILRLWRSRGRHNRGASSRPEPEDRSDGRSRQGKAFSGPAPKGHPNRSNPTQQPAPAVTVLRQPGRNIQAPTTTPIPARLARPGFIPWPRRDKPKPAEFSRPQNIRNARRSCIHVSRFRVGRSRTNSTCFP
jgi:hypothetical protein